MAMRAWRVPTCKRYGSMWGRRGYGRDVRGIDHVLMSVVVTVFVYYTEYGVMYIRISVV
jgi:hypothetical protein